MKKLCVILVSLCTAFVVNGQEGFRVGAKGAFNSTWLFNKHVSDAGSTLDYKSSFGSQFGISTLYNFNDNVGVVFEALLGTIHQKYTNRVGKNDSLVYETQTTLNTIDLPLLFKYTTDGGAFFEVGPEFSIINKGKNKGPGYDVEIPSAALQSLSIAAVLGFGYDIALNDDNTLFLNTGLRFAWGLTDTYKKQTGELNHEPTNTAVGGINLGITYAFSKK